MNALVLAQTHTEEGRFLQAVVAPIKEQLTMSHRGKCVCR